MKTAKFTIDFNIKKDSLESFKKFTYHIEYLLNLTEYPEITEVFGVEMEEIPNDMEFLPILKIGMFLTVEDNAAKDLFEKFTHHIEYLIDINNYPSIIKVNNVSYNFVD